MEEVEKAEFIIDVIAPQSTDEQLDRMTRQLLVELKELHTGSVRLAEGRPAPEGSKAVDPLTLGAISISVLPSVLPKIIEAAQAWALRSNSRSIKFKGKIGKQPVEFEGRPEELIKLLDELSKRKKDWQ